MKEDLVELKTSTSEIPSLVSKEWADQINGVRVAEEKKAAEPPTEWEGDFYSYGGGRGAVLGSMPATTFQKFMTKRVRVIAIGDAS